MLHQLTLLLLQLATPQNVVLIGGKVHIGIALAGKLDGVRHDNDTPTFVDIIIVVVAGRKNVLPDLCQDLGSKFLLHFIARRFGNRREAQNR